MGLADSKPANSYWVEVRGRRAHKQVTRSPKAGRQELGGDRALGFLGLKAAGSWKGRFYLGKWRFLSHVAPTRITMLIMAGMGGLDKDTQEGEKRNTTYIYIKKSLNCSEFLPVS